MNEGNTVARETGSRNTTIECPRCQSKALYRNGKTYYHQQRYLCLMCGRQFVPGRHRDYQGTRPECPSCGAKTHLFKKKEGKEPKEPGGAVVVVKRLRAKLKLSRKNQHQHWQSKKRFLFM